ncbi:hypothetical protein QQ020_06985 [Fulvivirgaceae bacterium BMA12]|uniref:Sortilin N-terminal domain-containing protein n=1 Tax=Agaribacillus aureus TaxID=3051825 RepID=A0ABT8L423_9BACT|nr:hypothetical protein [Fulvivirgaceae bacterium BMA12]
MKWIAEIQQTWQVKMIFRASTLSFCCCGLFFSCHNSVGKLGNNETKAQPVNFNGRNDAWDFTGPGGGGAMFSPTVSPHNPDHAFVSCDMTGSFATKNGGTSWRMFNLRGRVHFYVFDPQDPKVVYANSTALFKSVDGGDTWQVLYPPSSEIAGVISKGDHANEMIVTRDSTLRKVLALAVDPDDSRELYAAIMIDDTLAFYTSKDTGIHWTRDRVLKDGAKDIFVDPASPPESRTIYITGKQTVTARVKGTWQVNKGPAGVKNLTQFTGGYDPQHGKMVLYAISGKSYFDRKGEQSGIHFSIDGGKTWENRQEGLVAMAAEGSALPEWRSVATAARNPGVVYISYADMKVHEDTVYIGVAKSEDYAKTWQLVWKDNIRQSPDQPPTNMKDGWINQRFGPGWGENPFAMGVGADNPDVCYASDFGRTIKTVDGGKTWQQVYTKKKAGAGWISAGLQVTTGYMMAFDPFDENYVLMANTDTGLLESTDGAKSWRSATHHNGVPRNWVNSTYWLSFDPVVKNKLWAAMSRNHDLPRPKMWRNRPADSFEGGVLVSEDGGKTWQPTSEDIGEAAITHLLIDPESNPSSRTLYACAFGKGVYKSTDGGKTWEQKNAGIEGDKPFAWRIIRRENDGDLFLIVSRRSEDGSIGNDGDGALYHSSDGATSWTKVQLPHGTNGPTSLAVDPHNSERLVLSAWGRPVGSRFSPDIGGGIYLSEDNGANWTQVMEADQHIHDITIDRRNNVYYACGFNASAYRSEDRGSTWQRIRGYNFKWGKRVDPDPRDPEKIFIVTFGGGVWHGPAKGDKNAVEDIITPVLAYSSD